MFADSQTSPPQPLSLSSDAFDYLFDVDARVWRTLVSLFFRPGRLTELYLLGKRMSFDALYSLQSLVRTKTTGADGNFNLGRVSNPKLDQMIDAARIETDVAKRDAMLRDALKMTADEALYVPIHHQMRPWAMKKNITTSHRSDDRPEARFTRID